MSAHRTLDRLQVRAYAADDDDEALELDRICAQGTRFPLSFRRPTFRRRAESFDEWTLLTGRMDGHLVATAGIATRPARLFGRATTVAFGFDLRVHPAFRGLGIGTHMTRLCARWGGERAELVYSWIARENAPSRAVVAHARGAPGARYRYLVYPTYRGLTPRRAAQPADPVDVHRLHRRLAGPFDLYSNPWEGRSTAAHVASWVVREGGEVAACSAWDNSGILAEVVERLPPGLRLAGAAVRLWPLRRPRLPHIPRTGEALRSWYLHDAVATRPDLGRDLVRQVAAEAREAGIDFLYLIHTPPQAAWAALARRDLPAPLAPVLEYRLWGTAPEGGPTVRTAYVDIRDV